MRILVLASLALAGLIVPAGTAGAAVAPGHDHDCIVGTPPRSVDWSALSNPILSFPEVGVKDQALQWSGGAWHMLYSDMVETTSAPYVRFSVAISSSADLAHWSPPRIIATGAASPDIVRSPSGQFIVTYQTPSGLEYRTSSDSSLRSWSSAHPLGHGLAGRMIDGALAFTGHGVILGFKAGTTSQHFEIAWAPTLQGAFHLVGRPDIVIYNDTVENYEFLTTDGTWRLVATSNTLDQPFIFTLGPGDPSAPSTWLHWVGARQLIERRLRACQLRVPLRRPPGRGLPDLRRQHGAHQRRRLGPRPHRHRAERRPHHVAGTTVNDGILRPVVPER